MVPHPFSSQHRMVMLNWWNTSYLKVLKWIQLDRYVYGFWSEFSTFLISTVYSEFNYISLLSWFQTPYTPFLLWNRLLTLTPPSYYGIGYWPLHHLLFMDFRPSLFCYRATLLMEMFGFFSDRICKGKYSWKKFRF